MKSFQNRQVKNAIIIGVLCSVSYWACYFARNILSVMSPQIVATTSITVEFVGTLSTANMLCYAVGQLVNGMIGDRVKAKYLVSGGLCFSGICAAMVGLSDYKPLMIVAYSLVGFFLSMLYAPLVKLIAENTHPSHAIRCCLGLSLAALLGAPAAGVLALALNWKGAFVLCGIVLVSVGAIFFLVILALEKREIIKYRETMNEKQKGGSIKVLMEHEIVKFSLISIVTGVVRTSVVFWVPTYLSQYLGFSTGVSATIFTIMTFAQATSPYINNLILYEQVFKKSRNKTLLFTFGITVLSFVMMFIVKEPIVNIIFTSLALIMNDGAAGVLWNVYCPSLRDTGMVSSATGYLDFLSYMAAAVANLLFANAISAIGWGNLILVWAGLMVMGIFISIPWRQKK